MTDMTCCRKSNSNPKACSLTATGFSFCPGIRIVLWEFEPLRGHYGLQTRPVILYKWDGLALYTLHKFQLFWPFPFLVKSGQSIPISIFSHHSLHPSKEKSRGRAHIRASVPYNFFNFPGIIYPYIHSLARRNRPDFSRARVCGLQQCNFPRQICVHIEMGSRRANGLRSHDGSDGSPRLELLGGIILLGLVRMQLKSARVSWGRDNLTQSALVTWLSHIGATSCQRANLRSFRNKCQPHIILVWKNVWAYKNHL